MRTNFSNTWNWTSNFKSIKRYNWSFLVLTISILEVIFLFLLIKTIAWLWIIIFIFNSIFLLLISWKFLLLSISLGSFIISINHIYEQNLNFNKKIIVAKVIKTTNSGAIIKNDNTNIYINCFEDLQQDQLIKVELKEIKKIPLKNNSSFEKFLLSERVYFYGKTSKVKDLGFYNTNRKKVRDFLIRGPAYYSRYVPLLLIGYKNYKNQVVVEKLKKISILHLFTISGFHINIILFLIYKFLKFFKIQNKYVLLISNFILFPYLIIMGFPLAATRAFLFSILFALNKLFFHEKFHKLNVLAITIIILFIVNPNFIFSLSFIFTYLLTYVILIIVTSLNKKFLKLKLTLIPWFFSLLINIYLNSEINLSSLITNFFFTSIISFLYILIIFFFWLKPVINNFFLLLDVFINFFLNFRIFFSFSLDSNILISICFSSLIFLLIFTKKPSVNILDNKKTLTSWVMNW